MPPSTTLHLGLVGRQILGSPSVTEVSSLLAWEQHVGSWWPGQTLAVEGRRGEWRHLWGIEAGLAPPPSSSGCTGPSAQERLGGPVPGVPRAAQATEHMPARV